MPPRRRKLPAVLSEYVISPARTKPRISAGKALSKSSPLPKVTLKSGCKAAATAGTLNGSARLSLGGQQHRSSHADAKIATAVSTETEPHMALCRASLRQRNPPMRFKAEETCKTLEGPHRYCFKCYASFV